MPPSSPGSLSLPAPPALPLTNLPPPFPPPLGLQLFNLAMSASHECFKNIEINGVPKKVRVCMHISIYTHTHLQKRRGGRRPSRRRSIS